MNYKAQKCPKCGLTFSESDDIVVCPVCGTPQHRTCWNSAGGCVNADRHRDGYVWRPETVPGEKRSEKGNAGVSYESGKKYRYCPRCGQKNDEFEPVCTNCGERLKSNRETIGDKMRRFDPFFSDGENDDRGYASSNPGGGYSPYQNVYAADARMVFGENETIDDIPVTEVAEYVQKNSTQYIGKFLKMKERKTKISWNWSAGIFSAIWCFYRKMTSAGLILIAVFFSIYIGANFIPQAIFEKYRPQVYAEFEETYNELMNSVNNAITSGAASESAREYTENLSKLMRSPVMIATYLFMFSAFLLVSVIFGFFANYFYKRSVIKNILSGRSMAPDNVSYHMYLNRRGGVSAANVFIPIIIYFFLNAALTYL